MTFNNTTLPANGYQVAAGTSSSNPFVFQYNARDPNIHDVGFPIQKVWLNTISNNFWELKNFNTIGTGGIIQANWIPIKGITTIETLTADTGGPVPPTNNNINILGDGVNITTVGTPGTSTINIDLNGNIANTYVENTGSATPSAHILNVLGANGITTAGAGNTITIQPISGQLFLGNVVDAHTAPGTSPVVPDGSGNITVKGGQVAAGTTTHVIRTDSLAANTYTIEVQRSQAVASSTVGDNGVSHFNSNHFTVDSNGFVSIVGGLGFNAINTQVFTSSGTYTPTANMSYVWVRMVGGGGGSGGCAAASVATVTSSASGGGGGGEYAEGVFSAATIGASQAVTIGAGGAAGAIGNNPGGNAGTTSLGALMTAVGGFGGQGGPGATGLHSYQPVPDGGLGGSGGIGGTFRVNGNPGALAFLVSGDVAWSGAGGSTLLGASAASEISQQTTGTPGLLYGGGASGTNNSGVTNAGETGAAGAAGVIIITEYII